MILYYLSAGIISIFLGGLVGGLLAPAFCEVGTTTCQQGISAVASFVIALIILLKS